MNTITTDPKDQSLSGYYLLTLDAYGGVEVLVRYDRDTRTWYDLDCKIRGKNNPDKPVCDQHPVVKTELVFTMDEVSLIQDLYDDQWRRYNIGLSPPLPPNCIAPNDSLLARFFRDYLEHIHEVRWHPKLDDESGVYRVFLDQKPNTILRNSIGAIFDRDSLCWYDSSGSIHGYLNRFDGIPIFRASFARYLKETTS